MQSARNAAGKPGHSHAPVTSRGPGAAAPPARTGAPHAFGAGPLLAAALALVFAALVPGEAQAQGTDPVWSTTITVGGALSKTWVASNMSTLSEANNNATGAPAITGTPQVGQTLTAGIGTIEDPDGLATKTFPDDYTFQWIRVDGVSETDIGSATAQTYTPVADDVGRTLKVKVDFTDDDSNSESRTSDAYPASGSVLVAASACPADYLWCGTMTVGYDVSISATTQESSGYRDPRDPTLGSLSPATFTHAGTDYTVTEVRRYRITRTHDGVVLTNLLSLTVTGGGDLPDGTTLAVDGRAAALTVDTASHVPTVGQEQWDLLTLGNPPDWIDGQQVTASLDFPPTLSTATVDGTALVLTYDEALDATSVPAASAYAVSVAGSDRSVSSVAISGSAVTLTLASAVTEGQTVTVSYTVPTANPVQDAAGIDAAALADEAVTNNTAATNAPAITGTPQVDRTLTAGIGTIADADGLPSTFPDDYTFQWIRVDGVTETDIGSATAQTYTPVADDVGKTLKVKVGFTDDGGNSESRTSEAYPASGSVLAAASACPTGYTWCGTMTVGYDTDSSRLTTQDAFGYLDPDRGSLSPATFAHAGADYTVTRVDRFRSIRNADSSFVQNRLTLTVTGGDLPDGTRLKVDGRSAALTVGTDSHWVPGEERWDLLTLGDAPDWIDGQQVTASLDFPPTLSTATVDGTALVLTYDEPLDAASTPAATAYGVTVAGSARTVSSVAIGGSAVTLTLASAVTAGQTVTVSYTVPTANPVQDAAGIDAGALTGQAVTNNTNASMCPPTATWCGTMTVGTREETNGNLKTEESGYDPGDSPERGSLSPATFVRGGTNHTVSLLWRSKSTNTNTNTVTNDRLTVRVDGGGDLPDGTTLTMDGRSAALTVGTDSHHNEIGWELWNLLTLGDPPGWTAGQQITVSLDFPPSLSAATVNGTALVLTYDEDLDATSVPSATAYAVHVAGTARTVSNVAVSGSAVTLTLASPVTAGQTVTASYTVPTTNPVQDAAGIDAGALTDQPVTNNTRGVNTAATGTPAITGTPQTASRLTAEIGTIADGNGLPDFPDDYTFRWVRVAADGAETHIGSDRHTYTPLRADVGSTIRVEASFTDEGGYSEGPLASATHPAHGYPAPGIAPPKASCPADADWCTTMTVGYESNVPSAFHGYHGSAGRLSSPAFTLGDGTTYTASRIGIKDSSLGPSHDRFEAGFDAFLPRGSVLGVGGAEFTLDAEHEQSAEGAYEWPVPAGMNLVEGQRVTVSLSAPAVPVTPTLRFAAPSYLVTEGGGVEIQVLLSPTAADAVTVALTATGQNGLSSADYSGVPDSVTIAAGSASASFTVTATDDGPDQGEVLLLALGDPPTGVDRGSPSATSVTFYERESVGTRYVWFASPSYTATEGGEPATVTVGLSDVWKAGETLTLPLWTPTPQGGATAADFSGVPDSVSFAPGETLTSFTVTATDDSSRDPGESVLLRFGSLPAGVQLGNGPGRTTVHLADNDGPAVTPVEVSFGAASYRAVEGGANAAVTVKLSAAPGRQVRVPLTRRHLQNGMADSDYSGVPEHVTFGPTETEQGFTVVAVDDAARDINHALEIGFKDLPEGTSAGSPSKTVVHLDDDRGVPEFEVNFSSSSISIAEGGATLRPHVYLDEKTDFDLTIPLSVEHRGGATGADYTDLPSYVTIKSDERYQGFNIKAVDDAEADAGESLRLSFGELPKGVEVGDDRPQLTVEIIDNDAGPGLSVSDASALEWRSPQAVLEFEVTLDRKPDKEVRVDYATSDSTATAGTDYEAQSGTLVFRAGEDEKVVRVPVVFDRIRERAEYVKLTLSNARGAHIEDAVGVGKIRDYNTWAGIKGLSVSDASAVESSNPEAALNFKVRLSPASNQLVMVSFSTSDSTAKAGRDYEARSGRLVFLPGMREITVQVRVLHDTRNEGKEYMKLTLSSAVGADIADAVGVGEIRDPASSAAASAAGADADDIPDAVRGLTPERAAAVLFGEAALDPAAVQALDRLGNGNGRYDLGDLLSWIDRCRRGEADCGGTATDAGAAGGAALPAARGGGTSGRTGGRPPGPPERRPKRRARLRRGKGGFGALAMLLAAGVTWSCTGDAVGPAALAPDPGPLTVELSAPAANRHIGVLVEIEGPGIGTVRAPGYALYESHSSEPRRIVLAGPLHTGALLQLEVPDRNQLPRYRVRVLEVTGEDYGPRDPGEYRAVITN